VGQQHGHLSPNGIIQAKQLGARLVGHVFDLMYCSPLERCKRTLEELRKESHANCDVIFSPFIIERGIGIYEGMPFDAFDKFLETSQEDHARRPPGGESLVDVRIRAEQFLQELRCLHSGSDNILVCSHHNFNQVLASVLLCRPLSESRFVEQSNAALTVFESGDNDHTFEILALNDTSHLAVNCGL
jgi:broad specificity phosphatase PhoE